MKISVLCAFARPVLKCMAKGALHCSVSAQPPGFTPCGYTERMHQLSCWTNLARLTECKVDRLSVSKQAESTGQNMSQMFELHIFEYTVFFILSCFARVVKGYAC